MQPLVDKKYLLEKFPGKGGWTYAQIPDIVNDKKIGFGWLKVQGTIDGFELKKYHLAPMGNGNLFLPVRAEIRKAIKKQAGDWVHIILYPDNEPLETPQELWECLDEEPKALEFYKSLSESEQKYYINWIYEAKQEETKIGRIIKTIDRLKLGKKMYDQSKNV
jgi:Domain of unknown function (DUF1905)/Bacteriocin-protection, YdeI or OmpD-Associated